MRSRITIKVRRDSRQLQPATVENNWNMEFWANQVLHSGSVVTWRSSASKKMYFIWFTCLEHEKLPTRCHTLRNGLSIFWIVGPARQWWWKRILFHGEEDFLQFPKPVRTPSHNYRMVNVARFISCFECSQFAVKSSRTRRIWKSRVPERCAMLGTGSDKHTYGKVRKSFNLAIPTGGRTDTRRCKRVENPKRPSPIQKHQRTSLTMSIMPSLYPFHYHCKLAFVRPAWLITLIISWPVNSLPEG